MQKNEVIKLLGVSPTISTINEFVWVWNECVGDNYTLMPDERTILISNEAYEKGEKLSKSRLSKGIWKYKMNKEVVCQTIVDERAQLQKERMVKEQKEIEKKRIKEQQMKFYNEECDSKGYPSFEYLELLGIDYCTKEPAVRYFWYIIGNDYKVLGDGNILIGKQAWDIIQSEIKYGLSGHNFLNRSYKFKNRRGTHKITGFLYEKEKLNSGGVYGIYYENELIYIGMTGKSFGDRWKEHESIFKGYVNPPSGMILYKQNLKFEDLEFRVLFSVDDAKVEEKLTRRDIEAIELGFITACQPKYNYVGIKKPYAFSHRG